MYDVCCSQQSDHFLQTYFFYFSYECNKEVQERILHFLDKYL